MLVTKSIKCNTLASAIVFMLMLLCVKLSYTYLYAVFHNDVHVKGTDKFYSFNSLVGTKEFSCENLKDLEIGKKLGSGFLETHTLDSTEVKRWPSKCYKIGFSRVRTTENMQTKTHKQKLTVDVLS